MTGLNLETFLQLLRADLGAWASLGLVVLILAVMTWTSWGSRRALRKCLVLSIAAHVGLIVYGSSSPIVLRVLRLGRAASRSRRPRPSRVRVDAMVVAETTGPAPTAGRPRNVSAWDRDLGPAGPGRADPDGLARAAPAGPEPGPGRAGAGRRRAGRARARRARPARRSSRPPPAEPRPPSRPRA